MKCRVCQQAPFAEQPAYCGHCLIPVPPGQHQLNCAKCDYQFDTVPARCPNCQASIIEYPPIPREIPEIPHFDHEFVDQAIEDLGIEHLTREDQAVALSSIAREKMHLMSGDYQQQHGITLAQMAYRIALGLDSQWAQEMTAVVLASAYLKIADPLTAIHLLTTHAPQRMVSQIEQLRALEHRAYLTIAYRMAMVHPLADYLVPLVLDDIISIYHTMEPHILTYMTEEQPSEHLGMDRNDTKLPRLDYLVSILTILIEEAIIRGGEDSAFPDDMLDRFLELDNIIYQLGVMSPHDDPAFFAAQFRDYIRLFNGVFWYGDITIRNNLVKRQLVLEKGYERITQWIHIIPVHFFLVLRLSRSLEIFLRASSWSEKIKPDLLMQAMLDQAPELHQPQFLYIFAEAEANSQHFMKAKEHLAKMFSEQYEIHLEEDLKNMGQYMLQSIQLEEVGILLGVSRELRIGDSMAVIMDDGAVNFTATAGLAILGLAIFGDVLESRHSISDGIIQINSWKYDDPFWASPPSGNYSGHRMDVVIISTTLQSKPLHLIFEGKTQQIQNNQLLPSELLLLRATSFEVEESELIQLMADILEGHHKAGIVGLKSDYTGSSN